MGKNFKPVQINSHCLIRSEFHNNSGNFKDEIIITPKMSFGTGHHETTFLMINELYNLDLNDKSILCITKHVMEKAYYDFVEIVFYLCVFVCECMQVPGKYV